MNKRLLGIAKPISRSAPLLALGAMAGAALAYSVHVAVWHQVNARTAGRAPFRLVATPASQKVVAGSSARYQIKVVRGHYHGKVKLALLTPPKGLAAGLARANRSMSAPVGRPVATIALRPNDRGALLTVKTSSATRPGSYSVRVQARAGRYRGYLQMGLSVNSPQPAQIKIAGNFGRLWPGSSQAINLVVTNPNSQLISVSALKVSVQKISAPRATTAHPCGTADFAVTQYSGTYPLKVPARATVQLSGLGVPSAQQPRVTMLNRPVNQNGCQGATLTLGYSGTASGS